MASQNQKIKQLNEIFEKTKGHLDKIAYHFFQDRDIAENILQKTYIRIYRKLPLKFDHEVKLIKWCSVICKNLCIDYYRKKIKNRKLIEKIARDFMINTQNRPSTQDTLNNYRIQEIIEKTLNQISAKDRMIYTMYTYSTFSMREIAVMSACNMNSVRTIIRSVNKKIRILIITTGLSP